MSDKNEYQRGYAAGRNRAAKDAEEAKKMRERLVKAEIAINERRDRIYMQCLEMVVRDCNGWSIGGEKINNAEGYCKLAKVFADNAIKTISS